MHFSSRGKYITVAMSPNLVKFIQWAAVTINSAEIRDPPQWWLRPVKNNRTIAKNKNLISLSNKKQKKATNINIS